MTRESYLSKLLESGKVCDHMRRARMISGLSQTALADAVGVYASQISRYESGEMVPSLLMAMDLAKAVGVTLDEYVGIRPLPKKWVEQNMGNIDYGY